MENISPKRIAFMALQVSALLGVCIGMTCLLLPLTNAVAIFCVIVSMAVGYSLFVGYLGLSSLYLLLHYAQMNKRQAALAGVAIGLFALLWAGIFESGFNTIIHETGSILSTFNTNKGIFARLGVVNAVRDTYTYSLEMKMERDICQNEEDFLGHLPIIEDKGVSTSKLIRQLEAGYRAVSCF
ncbi:hypothetical protein [Desulfovibrio sp.]|uniref:hypothetical protein n=1 Tax=Desulfovibrio sp. TaxID=885 RepID=UPI0023C54FC3|nr:hypothetical protein [Desulfovibrio sp.]MDE7241525.1 hypothetical protein [Desulfovibrio sp.]